MKLERLCFKQQSAVEAPWQFEWAESKIVLDDKREQREKQGQEDAKEAERQVKEAESRQVLLHHDASSSRLLSKTRFWCHVVVVVSIEV
jgi:hypothetical protein